MSEIAERSLSERLEEATAKLQILEEAAWEVLAALRPETRRRC